MENIFNCNLVELRKIKNRAGNLSVVENSISMPFAGSLATHRCGIDPIAALVACTRNPATTFTDGSIPKIGCLREGSYASMNILNSERVEGWCQSPGMNPISLTIAKGNIVK